MFTSRTSVAGLILAASLTLLLAGGSAHAQGVGNLGSLPPIVPMNTNGTGWEIGVPTPLPVVLDPLGPVWTKSLTGNNGPNFTAFPGQTFTLHEVLEVSGTLPWTDWHEDLLNPNWSWTSAQIFVNGSIPSNLTINNTPGNSTTGGSISFLFDPAPVGSIVDIFKHVTYDNNPALPPFNAGLRVNQYPTPEPGSLLLLGGGSVLLLKRHRRPSAIVK